MDSRSAERQKMINFQLKSRGISDVRVLDAMSQVKREHFVPAHLQQEAYLDKPIVLGKDQTISQPYIVGYMCELLHFMGSEKVLEIGTGSGYQTGILSLLAKQVYTIEISEELSRQAKAILQKDQYKNIHFRVGNGLLGWPEVAPFDSIIVTACLKMMPNALMEQVIQNGKIVAPLEEDENQFIYLYEKTTDGFCREKLISVLFVPIQTRPASEERELPEH